MAGKECIYEILSFFVLLQPLNRLSLKKAGNNFLLRNNFAAKFLKKFWNLLIKLLTNHFNCDIIAEQFEVNLCFVCDRYGYVWRDG